MSTTTVKSMSELAKIVNQKIQQAIDLTYQCIHQVLQKYIDAYYDELEPKVYSRSDKLRTESLVDLKIVRSGDGFCCEVGFSNEYLNYKYPDTWVDTGSTRIQNTPATGFDIINWNNESGLHGGTVSGKIKIWDDAINELGGRTGIANLMKSNLRKCGLPVN